MLPCVCSVIDHRWRQNAVKTKKWHTSRKRVTDAFTTFHILCDLLLNKATWNLFVLYNDQKRKKTDTHTCLVPLDCSKICASLGIFSKHISFLLLFFFILLGYGFFETFFNVFLCSKQNNGENILQNSESRNDTRRQLLWRFLLSLGILKL